MNYTGHMGNVFLGLHVIFRGENGTSQEPPSSYQKRRGRRFSVASLTFDYTVTSGLFEPESAMHELRLVSLISLWNTK
jgi:hypothetical protein